MAFRKSYGTRKMTQAQKTRSRIRSSMSSAKKTVYKPPAQAIPALQRQVTRIKRAIIPLTQNKLSYQLSGNFNPGTATGDGFTLIKLSECNLWNRVFSTDPDDEQSHVFQQKIGKLKWQIITNGESALINYTIVVVSLTKLGVTELFNASTGGLNTVTQGTHYLRTSGFNGMGVFLNKRYFNIHYYRNTTTYSSSGYPGEGKPVRGGTIRVPNRNFINPLGDWKVKGYNPAAGSNMYLMVFNNDSTLDSDTAMQYNYFIQGVAV